MKRSSTLLDQIIEKAALDDEEHKKQMLAQNKAQKTVGQSWMIFHLLELKKIIKEESNEKE